MKRYGWAIGLGLALLLALLSPLASPDPDGLERVAEQYGFDGRAVPSPLHLIPEYVFPGLADERLATIVAGLLGTLAVFVLAYGLARLLRQARKGAD